MSGLTATAVLMQAATASNLYRATVGTTATTAVDLFATFGLDASLIARGRIRMTIRVGEEGAVGYACGAESADIGVITLASTSGNTRCSRIPAEQERATMLSQATRWIRFVGAAADTRVEVQIERG